MTRPTAPIRLAASMGLATFLFALPFAAPASGASIDKDESQDILGWVEWVDVGRNPLRLKAKLDTGATTSSLTAKDVEVFDKNGQRHVRFVVRDESRDIDQAFEAALVRHVRIRRHDGSTQRRPVVALEMCVGSALGREEFTLIDRSSFVYPVLVGRNYMKDRIIVDPGSTFVRRPDCKRDGDDRNAADAGATSVGARAA